MDATSTELQVEGDALSAELARVRNYITATQARAECAASCKNLDVSGLQLE